MISISKLLLRAVRLRLGSSAARLQFATEKSLVAAMKNDTRKRAICDAKALARNFAIDIMSP
ncbi:hypothetical protein B1812_04130 [Methylocystis bryophila]|uniref:Uncharacterized protein n=1 Tax=Methylocystis bryophila TaxID=655015 RepID=A0A1W6MS20_9HYPH|nr:hypothetical protein B1812_04130 [Methylocystis bryophila]